MVSLKSPLRYPGGKTRAVKLLMEYFPGNIQRVCSPFLGGGGSFEIELAEKGVKVYAYDNFLPLVNFWKELLDDPLTLSKAIQVWYNVIDEIPIKEWQKTIYTQNQFRQAVIFFILNRTTFGGTVINGGFYPERDQRFNQPSIDRVKNFKTRNLSVQYADFETSIKDNFDKFLYLDPPYVGHDRLYAYYKTTQKVFNHKKLNELLKNHKGWMLCYNDCELIREMYSEYKIVPLSWKYGLGKKESSEILILNT